MIARCVWIVSFAVALGLLSRAARADPVPAPPVAQSAAPAADTLALAPAPSPDSARPASVRTSMHSWQTGLLRTDRLQHASLSFTLAAGAGLAGASRARAFALTFALGTAKEVHDGRHGRFDVVDLAADAVGAALGALASARR